MWFLTHAWIIPVIMVVSFLIILLFGKKFPKGGSEVGITALSIVFILSLIMGANWIQHRDAEPEAGHHVSGMEYVNPTCSKVAHTEAGELPEAMAEEGHASQPVVECVKWFESGDNVVTIGTLIDGQSVMMLIVVSFISLLVNIFSTDYVGGDRRYTHYFAFLSLFAASMLFFVLAQNTLQMLVGWELVGLCSFALIGHWWEEKPNSDAALKAFLTNRVGDVGLIIGVIILYFAAGRSFSIIDINILAAGGGIGHSTLLIASLCLMAAVMSKSGQFILHTWLPDAMAGPTPVSALLHAATMVVAGIYMVARLYPVFFEGFSISGSSVNALAMVGAITAVFGALLAFVQSDIKKVLAYSTVSQLGFMVTALGMGAWTAALFHLFTHAFFKACLFLGAGSLSHACHHSFDMVNDMGGLRKVMPRTFYTYVIATLALAGIFPFAGFWSKDEILAGAGGFPGGSGANGTYTIMLVMLLIGAFCTAAYMTRTIWYAFFGEYRGHGTPHEGGPAITVPLVILAVLATIAGVFNSPWDIPIIGGHAFEHYVQPVAAYFPHIGVAKFNPLLAVTSLVVAGAGIAIVYLYYWKGAFGFLRNLSSRNALAATGKKILVNKYYFDYLYEEVIVNFVKHPFARGVNWVNQNVIDGVVNLVGTGGVASAKWVHKNIDRAIVDGTVNGVARTADEMGGALRKTQTGRIQHYTAVFFGGVAVLAAVFVLVIG